MADEIEKNQSTEIEKQGNSELGKLLIDTAHTQYKKERQERVLAGVRRYMELRAESAKKAGFFNAAVEWYSKKLDAIASGEFTFDEHNGELRFTDPDLNRANY